MVSYARTHQKTVWLISLPRWGETYMTREIVFVSHLFALFHTEYIWKHIWGPSFWVVRLENYQTTSYWVLCVFKNNHFSIFLLLERQRSSAEGSRLTCRVLNACWSHVCSSPFFPVCTSRHPLVVELDPPSSPMVRVVRGGSCRRISIDWIAALFELRESEAHSVFAAKHTPGVSQMFIHSDTPLAS